MAKTYRTVKTFPSKSKADKFYTVKIDEAGALSCDCPPWVYNRYGDRTCYHTRTVEAMQASPSPESKDWLSRGGSAGTALSESRINAINARAREIVLSKGKPKPKPKDKQPKEFTRKIDMED